jgi:hypothetical protein
LLSRCEPVVVVVVVVQSLDVSTMAVSLRKLMTCIIVVFTVACPYTSAKETVGALEKVQEQFDSLDGRGKFWVGAAVGFVGSRLALSSAVTVVKVGGVAFVTYVIFMCYLHYLALVSSNLDPLRICSFAGPRFSITRGC